MTGRIAALVLAAACLAAVPSKEQFVTTDDGVRLRYRMVGESGPFVIIPVSVFTSPHFDRLASTHRVVYYDPRGRGGSDTGDLGALSLKRNIRDVEALRRHLAAESIALIGFSGFGMEMAAYALEHPKRVTHLVQLGPIPPRLMPYMEIRQQAMGARIDKKALQRYEELQKMKGADPHEVCVAFQHALGPSFSAAPDRIDVEGICRYPNEHPEHQGKLWEAFAPSIADIDLRPRLRELTMPRLVIYGERELIPLEGVREWLIEDAPVRLVTVPGADHTAHIDRPDIVLPAIEEFLRR